ncbi:MAG: mechanosensitive ion channel family protein [Gammaproteobacteria bacterium]|nr:mechanosensitive ion channel family protein [Gammaproteobacteria bacterium]
MDWGALQDFFTGFYEHWQDLTYVIFILLGTLVATAIIHLLLRKRYKRPGTDKHVWRDAILGALNAPLQGVVWIIGLSIAEGALTTGDHMPLLAEVFPPARDVVAIALAAWFLIRLTHRALKNLSARAVKRGNHFDETAADAVGKLLYAVIFIIAALVMMQALGFSIASLLAFGGVAGIALGFAAQGLVANLIGGVVIHTSKLFRVGESIIIPGTDLMGEVHQIGWRATRVLGWNGKPFYIPNAKFNSDTIINHSRMAYRRASEYVYLRLEDIDKVPAIVEDVNQMLKEHADIGKYFVFQFDSYGDYALKLYLYAYTSSARTAYADYMRIKEDWLLKIAEIVKKHGAKLALPVSNLYAPEGLARQREQVGANGKKKSD